jgi:hypothetical protein
LSKTNENIRKSAVSGTARLSRCVSNPGERSLPFMEPGACGRPRQAPFYCPYGLSPFDGFYRAWLWDPYWAYPVSYPSGYFGYDGGQGEIQLTLEPRTVDPKLAEVYVNNAFAGTADHLKNMWLEPGAYELSILSKGLTAFRRRIYVLSGRPLKIAAKLDSVNPGEATESKP